MFSISNYKFLSGRENGITITLESFKANNLIQDGSRSNELQLQNENNNNEIINPINNPASSNANSRTIPTIKFKLSTDNSDNGSGQMDFDGEYLTYSFKNANEETLSNFEKFSTNIDQSTDGKIFNYDKVSDMNTLVDS